MELHKTKYTVPCATST